jgi:hypothetical protein
MKRIVITWILGVLIFCGSLTAYASENSISEIKPTIAILFTDANTKNIRPSTQKATKGKILGDIVEKFSPKYNIFIDDKRIEEIQAAGIEDLTTVERGDIMSFYKNDNIDFIVVINFLPTQNISALFSMTTITSIQLKIIDFKNNKYLYSGKHNYTTKFARMDGVYKELHKYIDAQMITIFPLDNNI